VTPPRRLSPYAPLGLAVLFICLGSIFVRLAAAPALAVAFYRIGIASLLVAPFSMSPLRRVWPTLTLRQRLLVLGSGIALGLHFATWISSLAYTSVAASVLLVNLAPLFTIAFARRFLGERISRPVAAATALALAGAGLIALGDWGTGPRAFVGSGLALLGAVTLSLYHVAGRGLRQVLPLNAYVLAVWGTAALLLGVLAVLAQVRLAPYPPRTLLYFVALAAIPTLGGHGLVNHALRAIPAPTVGLFLLGEPVGASALAYLVLGEIPSGWTLAGGLLVLVALAAVALEKDPN